MATTTAVAAVMAAATGVYAATQNTPKKTTAAQSANNPNADVYKNRNAQNALVQGNASTGTGSLLTSGNVAGNTLLGQ